MEDGLRTYEYFTGKLPIESLTPSFLIFSGAFRKSRLQMGLRRASSLLAGTAGLLLTAPLMAVIAAAIALDSRGPVFFVDRRAGRGGRPFNLVKFRTMHPLPPGRDGRRRRYGTATTTCGSPGWAASSASYALTSCRSSGTS